MRRKRRKAYKKWKMLTTAGGASQPSGQVCQKNMKDLEKEVEGDASEAVFHQARALGKSEGNGDERTSVSINRKQNSSSLSKDEKQPPSDSKIHQRTKNNDPPSAAAQQPQKGLPVISFGDYEKALSGNITIQDFPGTEEDFKPTRGKLFAAVKCGAFTVQVGTRKSIFCKTGARFSIRKRCPTCHQQFSVLQMRRRAPSRNHFPKHNDIWAEEAMHKVSSTSAGETTRTEIPSLNVRIVGKDIKVDYVSEEQNIIINITNPKRRGKLCKHRSLSSSHATKEPVVSPSQSHIGRGGWWGESKYGTSDFSHDSSADASQENLDTTISKSNMPNIPPSASDDSVMGAAPLQGSSDSDLCSLFSLKPQLTGEKAANIHTNYGRKPLPADHSDRANAISAPFSSRALRSPSLSPCHWATTHLEPVETPANAVSFKHCANFEIDQETVHATNRDADKAVSQSDSDEHTEQPRPERTSTRSPVLELAPCSSPPHSIRHSSVEWDQLENWENHTDMAIFNTDELEPRVVTQNDKEDAVDSNCAPGVRNPEALPPSLINVEDGKCQVMPVVEHACHSDGEVLTGENRDEVCFQVDFPPDAAASSCAGCATGKPLLIERTQATDADLYHSHGETRLDGFVQCQRTPPTRAHCEDESQSDSTETCHPPEDVLLSPLMQKALKDQNLEVSSLRKLSQDLSLRGGRASDGSQEEAVDQWARRRQQFKDRKRCSSAGGSSFASNITEGSITSDDAGSMDLAFRVDIGEKGFYTENFHSAAWVFRGDDGNPEDSPRCLSKKPGPVAVRERTVRLFKGTGDYPWGFRIQFSKPIMVTEVDTNSAAEEAGLQIGDVVLSVNGTEVTSVEHAEAVHLARKGPDILTLVVGSDISRCPNTPWPTCRGYLHKRTQSGFLKGWRKRWFVLKYDGYLHYYKHKKDEGKCPPLEVIRLEGAEVDIDSSLGKPFVFNCVPQSGNRSFCLCATSNQEMKRWLEVMHRAAHPTHQNHVWEDVTLHNSSLPPLAIKNPECLGLLHELERNTDTWVQHYCILKDGCLYFYTSIRSTQASGGLYLQGYRVSEQTYNFKQSVIELKPPSEEFKTFYFCAENTTENQRWITALKMSIKKWLPLDQAIHEFMNRPLEETRM